MILPVGDSPNPPGRPWVTYALIAANVGIYLWLLPLSFLSPDAGDPAFLSYLQAIADERHLSLGELRMVAARLSQYDVVVYRHGFRPAEPALTGLLSSIFLHGGLMHLAGNMLFLWIYGDNVEHRLGRVRYLLAYLGTGAAAGCGDALIRLGSALPAVGASGAISGVLGFYFIWFPHNRVRMWVFLFPLFMNVVELPARLVLAFYLLLDNLLPLLLAGGAGGVSHGAHIGGFLAGAGVALLGGRLAVLRPEPGLGHGGRRGPATRSSPSTSPAGLAAALRESLDEGRWQPAAEIFFGAPPALTRAALTIRDKIRLGEALAENGRPRAALAAFQRALSDHPTGPGRVAAHLGAARVQMAALDNPAGAYQHLYAALEESPDPAEAEEARSLLARLARLVRSLPRRLPTLFVASFLAAGAIAATAGAAGAADRETFPNGVASGDTGPGSTVLWTNTTLPGGVRFEVARSPLFLLPVQKTTVTALDPGVPVKAEFHGLRPGTRYYYRVTGAEGRRMVGSFRTAPRRGQETLRGLRFGVSGDWRGELAPYASISNAPARNLDFFVELGDTIYADFPSPAVPFPQAMTLPEYRDKHAEVYSGRFGLNAWADLRRTTSVFAMIDDHEVTNDFAGGAPAASDPRFPETTGRINETELYRNGLQAFAEFNPIREFVYDAPDQPLTDGKPFLYRSQTYGNMAALVLLDARSFRDRPLSPVLDPLDAGQIEAFLSLSFDVDPQTGDPLPRRSLLGRSQLDLLKQDLLDAQRAGITWKFVCVPEPIQNLGPVLASDRFEGYAAERTELLSFIDRSGIQNVVFVAADIHGMVVNNLTYQMGPGQPQIPTGAFEITTGSVAFDAPFGPTILDAAAGIEVDEGTTFLDVLLRALGLPSREAFDALPRFLRDAVIEQVINVQLVLLGYDPIGLERSPVNALLLKGLYANVFTFGWTEFQITPLSHHLWVTTYGIDPYTEAEVGPDLLERRPEVVSRFVVSPRR